MSAEESESLHEGDLEATDGEMYEVGGDDIGENGQPSWSSLTVAALKAALVERGLQTTGRKADLVARLEASQSCRLPLTFLHDTVCTHLLCFGARLWYWYSGSPKCGFFSKAVQTNES